MIKDFFKVLDLNKALFFGLLVMQGAMAVLFSKSDSVSAGTQMVLVALLLQFPMIAALYGFKYPRGRVPRTYRIKFGLKFVFLFGLAEISAVILALSLSPSLAKNPGLATAMFLLTQCITKPPILALAGTWLPADLVGHRMSLWNAFSRGTQRFWSSYLHVLLATLIQTFLIIAIGYVAAGLSGTLIVGKTDLVLNLLTPALMGMCEFLANSYIGVVLARQYMRAENITNLKDMISNTGVLLPHPALRS